MSWLIQILPHSCFMPDETMYCWWYLFSWFLERSYVVACIGQKLGFPQERDRRQKKAGCGGKFPIFNEPGSTPETLRLAYYFHFCNSLGLWQNSGCANRPQSKLNAVVKKYTLFSSMQQFASLILSPEKSFHYLLRLLRAAPAAKRRNVHLVPFFISSTGEIYVREIERYTRAKCQIDTFLFEITMCTWVDLWEFSIW